MVSTGGMTPVQALESATRNPAAFFGIESDLGRIAPNARADLVLLDANPLDDIRNTRKIRAVVAQGHLFDRAGLDSLLARVDRGVHGNGGSCEGSAK
jgi:imidazolonepropionase-like amidohydrolase